MLDNTKYVTIALFYTVEHKLMSDVRKFSVNTVNFRIEGKRWGNEQGIPTIAIHGWLDNAGSFDFLAPQLKNLNLYAIDLPGHGLSEHLNDGFRYHFIDSVQWIINIANLLRFDKFILLGHSLGAAITSFVASSFPERVSQAIMIDAIGPLSDAPASIPLHLKQAVKRILQSSNKQSTRLFDSIEEAVMTRVKASDMSVETARPIVERGVKPFNNGYTWSSDPKLLLPLPFYFSEEQALALLNAITAPTCLIKSKSGLLANFPVDTIQHRIEAIADIETHNIVGTHHVHLDFPQEVADIINIFINKHHQE